MDALAERQPACLLEVGPGSTLARMWTSRHSGIPARSLDDFQSPAAVAAWVAKTLG
jgi:[acyl-carrier-protein] S-malonyltransferase